MDEPPYDGYWPYYSVWWSWNASSDGYVTIRVESWACAKALALYTGASLAVLNEIVCDIDWYGEAQVQVSLPVTGGTAYQIMVDSRDGSSVQGELQIDFSSSP